MINAVGGVRLLTSAATGGIKIKKKIRIKTGARAGGVGVGVLRKGFLIHGLRASVTHHDFDSG